MRSRFLPVVSPLAAALVAAGCASGQPARAPGEADQYVTLIVRGATNQAKLEGNELYGPRLRLSFLSDGIRGVIDDQIASFDVREGGKIVGTVGGQPVDLYVRQGPDWMTVNGLFRGQLSDLRVNADSIQGNVARCGYTLRAQGADPGSFAGRRSCRGMPEDAVLSLPPALLARPAPERVVVLATLLASR
ncbi:MAG TPA: hypothetical protein VFS43_08270 [Polyangiaceae bacterium]|nr:hypothetical protein [Polyangiaceae bacterium]